MAGLACAGALHAAGAVVTAFGKSRGVGGRLATRRVDDLLFNHGAQHASAHGPEFQAVLDGMGAAGDAAPWPAPGAGCWAGTPGMSAMARHMGRLVLWDAGAGLGVCGGWCLGRRVEDSCTSGRALAGQLRLTRTALA